MTYDKTERPTLISKIDSGRGSEKDEINLEIDFWEGVCWRLSVAFNMPSPLLVADERQAYLKAYGHAKEKIALLRRYRDEGDYVVDRDVRYYLKHL